MSCINAGLNAGLSAVNHFTQGGCVRALWNS